MKIWEQLEKKHFASLYLLYGTESYIINETKQKIVTNVLTEEELDFNLSVYDMEETPIEQALEDAETLPFFGEKKLVILNNPIFLTTEKAKEKVEHNVKKLETYIQSPAPYTILVFAGNYEKLDERKKITKLLKKHGEVIEGKKLNEKELIAWVQNQARLRQIKMDQAATDLLIHIVGTDLTRLHSELEKIFLYADTEKEVYTDTVEKLATRSLEQNIFDLIDKVVQRKMDQVFRIYYDLRKQNEEPIKILALIASQFRLIYQVKELVKRGYGQSQIASTLKVHPFRVKLAAGQASSFSETELGRIITLLSETDLKLKTGGSGREIALEMFLLQLGNLNK